MEKQNGGDQKNEDREKLGDFFMELFTPEFLESLPPEQINTVVDNLRLVESGSTPIPPQWEALKRVLTARGFISI